MEIEVWEYFYFLTTIKLNGMEITTKVIVNIKDNCIFEEREKKWKSLEL